MSISSNLGLKNKKINKKEIVDLLNTENNDIIKLMALANDKQEKNEITYSKNVFIPLSEVCRNYCGYCTFRKDPNNPKTIILKDKNEVIDSLKKSEKYECKEALFTFGEEADTEIIVKKALKEKGFENMVEYVYDICDATLNKTNLLPHTNAGVLSYEAMKTLKEVNVSMGMMLESSSARLTKTIAHENSPGKDPKLRIKTIANAG
ncbi:MAG: 7,8-didemethyl-8-hydroxy-5-deazariboflavin synthase subunit CofG, partial [Methanobrevibacter sp.]|nr:7,8-didemethyl-8-hydroxy-5-deazariboflavin synthase subunit CofG [Methanobrevibacter sp.]